jgi:predicted ATP-dependent endonuclease of OLD family
VCLSSSGVLVLLGENNAGKSNLTRAIEILFGDQWPGTRRLVTAQVAVDAFAMRHHLAEAVLTATVTASRRSVPECPVSHARSSS